MRKILFSLSFIIMAGIGAIAQVSINADSSLPDSSAGLEVKFNDRGFLPPRMTRAGMYAITSPAAGLVVFCTNCGSNGAGALCAYKSLGWHIFNAECITPLAPASGTHETQTEQITWNWQPSYGATGYKWSSLNSFAAATDLGDTTSYTETFLTCNTGYTRYIWAYNACGPSLTMELNDTTSSVPFTAPTAGTQGATSSQITWRWNTVPGAWGYKWNTANDYTTATNMGYTTSKTETGLSCNTSYTRYVWAYDLCGRSEATSLSQTTSSNPPSPGPGTNVAGPTHIIWNWIPVVGATGYKWSNTTNYANATNMGLSTTKTETGLACGTMYTRYVWSYNACGNSTVRPLVFSTAPCGLDRPDSLINNGMAPLPGNVRDRKPH